jgi:hypothetical protein
MDDAAFLAWLAEAGIEAAPRRSGAAWLHFAGAADGARTWPAPGGGGVLSAWLAAVVRAASARGPWWLWPRGGGGWYGGFASVDEIAAAAAAAGVPRDFAGALGFAAGEVGPMMRILHAFAAWPWGGADDLYLVPGDRSCVVNICHDEEIHVHAADGARLRAFAGALAEPNQDT